MSEELVRKLAADLGGTIEEISGPLADGSGFATMSLPLPADHWLTKEGFNVPPMPFRLGERDSCVLSIARGIDLDEGPIIHMTREEFAEKIRAAARHAVRASTDNGLLTDFDPDAMVGNFVIGLLGYWTETGLSADEWANPPKAG